MLRMAGTSRAAASTRGCTARHAAQPASLRPVRQHVAASPVQGRRSASLQVRMSTAQPDALAGEPEPETAKEAIELGNKYAKAQRWNEALDIYERALALPGTGLKRYRDKPRLISDGEKSAALFNCACCHSMLGDARSGLVALAGCLELGYDDFAQLRADPDLATLRKDERFEGLMKRFERKPAGFFSGLFGGSK